MCVSTEEAGEHQLIMLSDLVLTPKSDCRSKQPVQREVLFRAVSEGNWLRHFH